MVIVYGGNHICLDREIEREGGRERGRNSYRFSNKLENFCSSTAMGDQFFFKFLPSDNKLDSEE